MNHQTTFGMKLHGTAMTISRPAGVRPVNIGDLMLILGRMKRETPTVIMTNTMHREMRVL